MISLAMLLCGSMAFGQTDDPVLMTINGKPVKRSAFEFAYKKYQTAKCPNCGANRLNHRVCPSCGYYNGKQVLTIKAAKKDSAVVEA